MRALLLPLVLAGCAVRPGASDLHGWQQLGDAQWQISGGEASAVRDSGLGYLASPQRYADVEFEVEFFVEADTNSGVFVRCADLADINPETCFEFNIWDNHPNQQWRTGALVTIEASRVRVDVDGQWNHYRVRVQGSHLQAWINGVQTVDRREDGLVEGNLALQYGGEGMVRFRNVRVSELPGR